MNAPCTIHSMGGSDNGLLSNYRGCTQCTLHHANNDDSDCRLLLSAEAARYARQARTMHMASDLDGGVLLSARAAMNAACSMQSTCGSAFGLLQRGAPGVTVNPAVRHQHASEVAGCTKAAFVPSAVCIQ